MIISPEQRIRMMNRVASEEKPWVATNNRIQGNMERINELVTQLAVMVSPILADEPAQTQETDKDAATPACQVHMLLLEHEKAALAILKRLEVLIGRIAI